MGASPLRKKSRTAPLRCRSSAAFAMTRSRWSAGRSQRQCPVSNESYFHCRSHRSRRSYSMHGVSVLQRLTMRYSGGFVVALHEIAPERVAELVDCLQPARAVHLSELVRRSKACKSTSGLFAITVDDGVGENVRALAGLFQAKAWPATFYVPTHYLSTGEEMMFQWWRRLKPLLPLRKLELKSGVLDLSFPGALEEWSRKMETRWYTT